MKIFECDMCKKILHDESETHTVQIENPCPIDPKQIAQLGVSRYSTFGTYDLCHDCAKRVEKFIKDGLTEVVIPIKPSAEDIRMLKEKLKTSEQTKPKGDMEHAMEMRYTGYSEHDSESHYECPVCKNDYGSWSMFNKGINKGETFFCWYCDQKLIAPK